MIIAAQYGLGQKTDALFVALTIPQLIASLLLVSFNVTLVPIFSAIKLNEGTDGLYKFASNLIGICLIGMGLVAVLGALLSGPIVSLVAPGLNHDSTQLSGELGVLLFLMLVPLGTVEVSKALLNALHSFGPPAATNLLRNSAVVVATLALGQQWDIKAVAIGYVIGSWLQALVVGIALLGRGFRYTPRLSLREEHVHETWRSLRLPLLGGAINLSNTLIERFLVSFLPAGTISALSYARRILWATDSVFLGSIATALLPRLSDQSARENEGTYRHYLDLGLKLSLFVAMPIMAGTIALGVPAVRLAFQRGAFDQAATQATATYLSLYMLSIPASALTQILLAGFYARRNTVTPFYILVASLALTFALDVGLFVVLEARGLALGLSLAKLLGAMLAFYLLRRSVGQFAQDLGRFVVKIAGASLILGIVATITVRMSREVIARMGSGALIATTLELVVGGTVGATAYALCVLYWRIPEVTEALQLVRARLAQRKLESAPLG